MKVNFYYYFHRLVVYCNAVGLLGQDSSIISYGQKTQPNSLYCASQIIIRTGLGQGYNMNSVTRDNSVGVS
jgi:hypothetical protein